jgi:hypothetical protein
MKRFELIIVLLMAFGALSQPRDLTPNKKRQAFGKRDFRNLNMYGLQVQIGPTYTLTRLKNRSYETTVPGETYTHDPSGLVGFFAEVGMAHFPKKRSKLSLWLKTVLVSYYDWGLGYKRVGGKEVTTLERLAGLPNDSVGKFYNGFVYGRFSIHKNIHIGKTFFLDNGLGINVDYKLVHGVSAYVGEVNPGQRSLHNPLIAQLHYSLGFGIKLKRGSYLIPGIRTPILGYQGVSPGPIAGNGKGPNPKIHIGNPAFQWFSSKYWPIYPHVKFIYMFEKRAKGCPPVEVNDQDKNTQRGR